MIPSTSNKQLQVCKGCGKEFEAYKSEVARGGGRYCSTRCWYDHFERQPPKKIKKVCKQCGKTFEVNEKYKRDRERIFCDQDCYNAHRYAQDIRTCPICNKTFPTFKSTKRKYCSLECTQIGLKRPRNDAECTCLQCGKEFFIPKAWVRKGEGKYCSNKCQNLAQIKERVNLVCGYCGKDFEVRLGYYKKAEGTGRFCSVDCYNNDRTGLIKLECEYCGKEFETYEIRPGKYCSQKCGYRAKTFRVERECEHCGKKFEVLRANLKKEGVGRYCSVKCTLDSRLPTNLEIRGSELLNKIGVNFEEQYVVGVYVSDVFIPEANVIIEWDGDYWHSLKNNMARDQRKDRYLRRKGFTVLRFWEHEVYQEEDYVVDTIKQCINSSEVDE